MTSTLPARGTPGPRFARAGSGLSGRSLLPVRSGRRDGQAPGVRQPDAVAQRPLSQRLVLLVVLTGVPLTFIAGSFGGFELSGLVWIGELAFFAPLLLINGLVRRSGRYLIPYLIFVEIGFVSLLWTPTISSGIQTGLQFLVPALAYLLAWQLPDDVRPVIRKGSTYALGFAAFLTVGALAHVVPGQLVSIRPMAIALLLLYIVFSACTDSRSRVLSVGIALAGLEVATGSRTAALVAVGILATNGRLGISRRTRTVLLVGLLAVVVAFTQTLAFRQRVFFDPNTTVQAYATGKAPEQLNTSGRLDYWPRIFDECKTETWRGEGLGASYSIAQDQSDGALTQPHQELLRTFCDTGLPGASLFWIGFVGWAVVRSYRKSRRHPGNVWHSAALQGMLTFTAVAMTDNPLVYTGHFMVLLFVVLGLSDRCVREA